VLVLQVTSRRPIRGIMSPHPHILGVILAGGASRRMGGGDKGFADLGGQPMLAHVIRRFQPQVFKLILNANGDQARFANYAIPVVPDLDDSEQGPMSGIIAAMDWARRTAPQISAVVTVTTDIPFLPLDLVARLAAASPHGPAIAVSGGQRHPTAGLWPLALKSALQSALDHKKLSVNAFAEAHSAIAVSFPFGESGGSESSGVLIDPFFNANTPDDLAAARALLSRQT
jgi:molybdenum cofactor guanylyltransferase